MMYTAIGKPVQFYIQCVLHMHGLCDKNKEWTEFKTKVRFESNSQRVCEKSVKTLKKPKLENPNFLGGKKMENTKNLWKKKHWKNKKLKKWD